MKQHFGAFIVGVLFAVGLGISGMTQPQKVIGFLDIFGNWDPSIIFVMCGAILVHFFSYRMIRKRKAPWFSDKWHIPTRKDISPALVLGSLMFGIGWGLGGYCPGPAVTSLASFQIRPFIFVLSMILGMVVFRGVDRKYKLSE
jgi:uncharacterized membrane protein YedE/YeeE